MTCLYSAYTGQAEIRSSQKQILPLQNQTTSDVEVHKGLKVMRMFGDMAGPEDISEAARQVGVPRAVADTCSSIIFLPQTSPVAHGSSWPSMWHNWLLDLEQTMNDT